MAPIVLSNSSFLLADAIVEEKSTDFETTIPKKIQKVKLTTKFKQKIHNYECFLCVIFINLNIYSYFKYLLEETIFSNKIQ